MDHQPDFLVREAGQIRQRMLHKLHMPEAQRAHDERGRQSPVQIDLTDESGDVMLQHRLLNQINGCALARAHGDFDGQLRGQFMMIDQMIEHFAADQRDEFFRHANWQRAAPRHGVGDDREIAESLERS